MAKRKQSRADRWMEAVEAAKDAIEMVKEAGENLDLNGIQSGASDFEAAMQDLADVKNEYQEWYDNMPENLQDGPTGEKLACVIEVDVESAEIDSSAIEDAIREAITDAVSEAEDLLNEAENVELPVGFGRD